MATLGVAAQLLVKVVAKTVEAVAKNHLNLRWLKDLSILKIKADLLRHLILWSHSKADSLRLSISPTDLFSAASEKVWLLQPSLSPPDLFFAAVTVAGKSIDSWWVAGRPTAELVSIIFDSLRLDVSRTSTWSRHLLKVLCHPKTPCPNLHHFCKGGKSTP